MTARRSSHLCFFRSPRCFLCALSFASVSRYSREGGSSKPRRRAMLLRKRPQPPMRRTTSMTEFAADGEAPRPVSGDSQRGHPHLLHHRQAEEADPAVAASQLKTLGGGVSVGADWIEAGQNARGVAPPGSSGGGRGKRRNSGGFEVSHTASFLMACGLCRRRLGPGRDTFMYRGDTAFCSLECRQQHINQVEINEKCSLTSMKDAQATKTTEKSDNGEFIAAA